jgi:hypothetical protein
MSLYEMEYPLLEVIKHANQHLMEEFRLDEIAHNIWNLSKYIELSVKMAQREFGNCGSWADIA